MSVTTAFLWAQVDRISAEIKAIEEAVGRSDFTPEQMDRVLHLTRTQFTLAAHAAILRSELEPRPDPVRGEKDGSGPVCSSRNLDPSVEFV